MERGANCYPINRDARRRADQPADPVPHPRPEVPATAVGLDDDRVPLGARRLAKAAHLAGWRVLARYARGTTLDARGRPGRVVDDLALRLQRGRQGAVAHWVNGAFDMAYVVTVVSENQVTSPVIRKLGARDLRAVIDAPEYETRTGDGQ